MRPFLNKDLKFLYSLQFFGIKLGLKNITDLCNYFGNPQNNFPSIHIAGTNGKGTVAHAIASCLMLQGYKVGLYTSPHLINFNERIKINNKEISNKKLSDLTTALKKEIIKCKATFFEATTAIAFKYFSDSKVDIAVVETGLGGRLDATNILNPICSVITEIGFDHTKELGKTIEKITSEKGGIIKTNNFVFTNSQSQKAIKVLQKIALQKKSIFIKVDSKYDDVEKNNLELAKEVLKFIDQSTLKISNSNIISGLKNYKKISNLRARFEVISDNPKIIVDVAHNPDAIKNLVLKLKSKYPNKNFVFIFGVMKDKNYKLICNYLAKLKPILIAVKANNDRALNPKIIANYFNQINTVAIDCGSISTGIKLAKRISSNKDIIVITGSHYVVGEYLQNKIA
ncbi:MAG: bifunctional folylpolyglutamate synthase/dihydrofolate synthase [Bacteroidetes bacterium]|nr:bifunctional folylpolyglutamate synthase/dihydrofolate synthase [Bacteroidota bacterium]